MWLPKQLALRGQELIQARLSVSLHDLLPTVISPLIFSGDVAGRVAAFSSPSPVRLGELGGEGRGEG